MDRNGFVVLETEWKMERKKYLLSHVIYTMIDVERWHHHIPITRH
jgi:hypothetical protein